MKDIIDLFLHLDEHLIDIVNNFGIWSYALLFGVVFMETGFVVTPFLPGDSLLFAAGTLAGVGTLKILPLYIGLIAAAIIGDTVNYWIGSYIGPKAYNMNSRFMKKEYLDKAQDFYDKHGGKAIVLARFMPIVRTFAPFVAGVGKMNYPKFISYNVFGAFLWVTSFTFLGYFFGNIPFVKENFHYGVVIIIIISVIPLGIEFVKTRRSKK